MNLYLVENYLLTYCHWCWLWALTPIYLAPGQFQFIFHFDSENLSMCLFVQSSITFPGFENKSWARHSIHVRCSIRFLQNNFCWLWFLLSRWIWCNFIGFYYCFPTVILSGTLNSIKFSEDQTVQTSCSFALCQRVYSGIYFVFWVASTLFNGSWGNTA